jgi:hypothetical protein
MAQSSDELIKREIFETLSGSLKESPLKLRIFPQSSRDDQTLFSKGGLTFGVNGVSYGSCDAVIYIEKKWRDPYDSKEYSQYPVFAIEGTDALNRRSSGNAQYQRFHHALGAVKSGVIGIYYLRKGNYKIQEDLFGMAFFASQAENGIYLIIDDLEILKNLVLFYGKPQFRNYVRGYMNKTYEIFKNKLRTKYSNDWLVFAKARSTIVKQDYVIKYAARMSRNFTDSSQRAGHIALGEMYLSKYYFKNKKLLYLFLKMTSEDLKMLDASKQTDKEWFLLRNEQNVSIKTLDDIKGLDTSVKSKLLSIKDQPLNNTETISIYNSCVAIIVEGLENNINTK